MTRENEKNTMKQGKSKGQCGKTTENHTKGKNERKTSRISISMENPAVIETPDDTSLNEIKTAFVQIFHLQIQQD